MRMLRLGSGASARGRPLPRLTAGVLVVVDSLVIGGTKRAKSEIIGAIFFSCPIQALFERFAFVFLDQCVLESLSVMGYFIVVINVDGCHCLVSFGGLSHQCAVAVLRRPA